MRVTCVGDCGVDRYLNHGYDRAGGITLNVAVNARQCFDEQARVGVISALGTDRESEIVLAAIERQELVAHLPRFTGRTSIQYIDREPSGEKIFLRYQQGVLGDYRLGDEERRIVSETELLVTTVYDQILGFFDSVMSAPSPGLRAVDFGDLTDFPDPMAFLTRYRDGFHIGFFGLTESQRDVIEALAGFARAEAKLVIITLGAAGSLAFGGRERLDCPAAPVARVADTTGAGDAFAAGFLGEYCRSKRVADALAKGAESAARVVARVGAFDSEVWRWEDSGVAMDWEGLPKAESMEIEEEEP